MPAARRIRCPNRDRMSLAGRTWFGPPPSNHIVKAETLHQPGHSARAGRCAIGQDAQRRRPLFGECGSNWGAAPIAVMLLAIVCGLTPIADSRCPADERPAATNGNGGDATAPATHTSRKLLVTSLLTESLREEDWLFYSL